MKQHFDTLIRHLPQIEPLLFVQQFTILSPEGWDKKFAGSPHKTAVCTPQGFWFHQEFWASLPFNKQVGLVLHEVFHGALGHLSDPFRDFTLPPHAFQQLANIAQDIVIENAIYELANKIQTGRPLEKRDIAQQYDPQIFLPYAGMSWRQVYEALRSQMKQQGQGEGPGPVCDLSQARGQEDSTSGEVAQRWEAARQESESIKERVRNQGSSGSGQTIDIAPEQAVIPWQTYLINYLVSAPWPVRKQWSNIKRRPFTQSGAYVPKLGGQSNVLPIVNLFLDTSGSMSGDYGDLAAEVMAICSMAKRIHRIDYDVGVAYQEVIEDPEDYVITQLHGGGGTCFQTALNQMLEDRDFNRDAPVVVLTDGGDTYDVGHLGVPCVFVSYGCNFTSDAGPVFMVKK